MAFWVFAPLLSPLAFAQTAADAMKQGDAAKAKRDYPAAMAAYSQAVAQNPRDAGAYILRGSMRAKLGDNAGAIADDDAALALDPKNAIAMTNRANARAAAGDLAGAKDDYSKALDLDPGHVAAFLNRANVEAMQRDYAAALPDYNAALALDPKNPLALYDRAGARRAVGTYAGAIADYSQVLLAQPNDVRARLNRAVVRMAQRDWKAARADLEACVRQLPPDQQIYPRAYLWVISALQGDVAGATAELQRYRQSIKYSWTPSGRIVTFLAGEMQEWQFLGTPPPGSNPQMTNKLEAQAHYFAGVVRLAQHDPNDARARFEKCIALGDPRLHEVILAREELKEMGKP